MTVIGVSGHQDIPEEAMPNVLAGIRDTIWRYGSGSVGVCSLAAGADQIFAQAILDADGVLHVVIPCERYGETFDLGDLLTYHRLLSAAEEVETLAHPDPTEKAFLDAGHRVADSCDVLIAVWDGHPTRGLGGTGEVVGYAESAGRKVVIIWPHGVTREA